MWLPRFRIESALSLREVLSALGMARAFSDAAEFTEVTPPEQLKLGNAIQRTFVDVSERGTEAAAASGVTMDRIALPEVDTLRVDWPFVFLIRERFSGAILFMGDVAKPAAD